MQKNWYLIYIKQNTEKKIVALLKKNQIESFCPVNCRQIKRSDTTKLTYEPLFNSYLFANLKESDFSIVERIKNVLGIVHWVHKPAKIRSEEIEAIRKFTHLYRDIALEKSPVNAGGIVNTVDGPTYSINRNIVSGKRNSIKLSLPSLGFRLIAQSETENVLSEGLNIFTNQFSEQL
ncbi:MAG: UpxY family transcription antiterminator [Ginsengibacter sp.]